MWRTLVICLFYASSAATPADVAQTYPRSRGGTSFPPTEWALAPIVAIGEVSNSASYGEQTVDHLPYPMAPRVHKLYWCQADFHLTAVVKGELHAPRKYLWASGMPGCDLYGHDPELATGRYRTRAWFLREEGMFLRPLFDYGAHHFVGLCAKWEEGAPLPARRRLGAMLLTPEANCEPLDYYADYLLGTAGDLACEVLSRAECFGRIRSLARSENAALRAAACLYLKGQQQATCE